MSRAYALASFVLVSAVAPLAHGIPFDSSGSQSWRTQNQPPRVAPSTSCTALNYASYADPTNDEADSYMFAGWCKVNVAPEGKPPVLQKVNVQIQGEWSPKMKRASEIVKVVHPDKTFQFTTWATCDKNPFLMGAAATCKDQGMGGSDFSLFIRREDAPLAKSRVDASRVAAYTARAGSRAQMRAIGTIKSMELTATEIAVGQQAAVKTNFTGGPGACPMEIDFGDGYVPYAVTGEGTTFVLASHPYTTPGVYTITARPLPGCTGTASAKITVKQARVEAIAGRDGASRMGQPAGILVTGRSGTCRASIDFGDGKTELLNTAFSPTGSNFYVEHTYLEPGRKALKVSGTEMCSGSATGFVDIVPSKIISLKNMGAEPPFQILRVTAEPGVCPMRVDWGDGSVEEMKNAAFPGGTLQIMHQPKKKGKLLVSVTGIDGCLGTAGEWLQVN